MHDKDLFARTLASDPTDEQARREEVLNTYDQERRVTFKEEIYLVRDNGAVFRLARPQTRQRRLDEVWMFGTLNRHSGYFEIVGHVVHRIVAKAFLGPGPSPSHVVDHIDTNRLNNRPDNLRWVTRLENILLNPITRARIEAAFGSLDAFFDNPGALLIPRWEWMRVVTKEEAEQSRKRLLAWAEQGKVGMGGSLGDWVFKAAPQRFPSASESSLKPDRVPLAAIGISSLDSQIRASHRAGATAMTAPEPDVLDTPSLTANAIQRKWRTPTEFPQCPGTMSSGAMAEYLQRLTTGALFSRNRYGESRVVDAAIGPDGALSVVCTMASGVKDWSHATVFVEGHSFCHKSGGTFFTREGAMKSHCIAIGAPFDAYDGSIDDYC
jgi:hypothetical protein